MISKSKVRSRVLVIALFLLIACSAQIIVRFAFSDRYSSLRAIQEGQRRFEEDLRREGFERIGPHHWTFPGTNRTTNVAGVEH